MRILHYTLGLPPYRSGGLTKYATDLMLAQGKNSDQVSLLYPGDYTFWKLPNISLRRNKPYKNITVFEIINPITVPLLHGIKQPLAILNPRKHLSEKALTKFYNEVNPDVFHIHTLMGLPPELLIFLKRKKVRIIYSSHDYYGLCFRVNFIDNSGNVCQSPSGKNCAICNSNAPGLLFLKLRNSKYLLKYKAQLSKGTHTINIDANQSKISYVSNQKTEDNYSSLLKYYQKLFSYIDCFHFNSSIAKEVYEQFLFPKHSWIIPISHENICDNRKLKKVEKDNIKLGFIGSTSPYKGFPILKKALCELIRNGIDDWSLQVWGGPIGEDSDCNKISYRGVYSSNEMAKVFSQMDLLIVPSICKETFSLTTLEALSLGVPVLVSSNVGAKDIVVKYNPMFIFDTNPQALQIILTKIFKDIKLLENFNKTIVSEPFEYSLKNHLVKIKKLYLNTVSEK